MDGRRLRTWCLLWLMISVLACSWGRMEGGESESRAAGEETKTPRPTFTPILALAATATIEVHPQPTMPPNTPTELPPQPSPIAPTETPTRVPLPPTSTSPPPEAPPEPTSPLPTPTPVPTAKPAYPFTVQGEATYFNNCASSGIFGWIYEMDGRLVGWATVRIWNGGQEHFEDSRAEAMPGGDRNWEWISDQRGPKAGTWSIQIVDKDTLVPKSAEVVVGLNADDCTAPGTGRQWARVDFRRNW